jgi:hypothetical protein
MILPKDKMESAHFELNKQLKGFKTLKEVNDALFFTPKQQDMMK